LSEVDLSVTIGRLKLRNPVLTASGTCGYGEELAPYCPLDELGAVIPKSVTVNARDGNKPPRLWETPSGLLNSIGLQNEGLEHFVSHTIPKLAGIGTPVIANIAGFTVDEFVRMAARLSEFPEISGLEVNISCPNVKVGGMAFGASPLLAAEVTKAVRRATGLTIILKLSPNVTDITEIARAVEAEGADAVSAVNTFLGMAVDAEKRIPKLGNVTGGLSGPAIKPIALRMVWQIHSAVKIPVIGLGGICNGTDAIEFILCGASAVEVGTGALVEPSAPLKVVEGIREYCVRQGVSSVAELIGGLRVKSGN